MNGPAEIIVEGGTIVTDAAAGPGAVVIGEGRVQALVGVESAALIDAERRIDASGKLVVPGGVDPHCHVGIKVGEYTTLDTYESASLAALAGGTTTMIDFAIPSPGEDPLAALDSRLAIAAGSRCDYAEHGCINDPNSDVVAIVGKLVERGVRTIKLFTTYRDILMVDAQIIESVMQALSRVGGLTYVHAESNELIEAAQTSAEAAGRIGAEGHAGTRPESAEDRAVADVLAVAERVGAAVYFVHQSTPGAIDLVQRAKARGVLGFTESCPHYLTLDEQQYAGPHPERWVCCPPLRPRPTVEAVAQRAVQGLVDTIGSDNCCYDSHQKQERASDVRQMPNGLPGVETRMPVIFDRFVAHGGLPPERFVAMVSSNPARLNGLYPRKGTIAVGSDADVVIIDPTETRTVTASALHMPTDYSPYEGRSVTGWPSTVISRGRVVVDEGRLIDPGPVGEFLHAQPIDTAAMTAPNAPGSEGIPNA